MNDVYYGENSNDSLVLKFHGNRIDIIAGMIPTSEKLGSAKIRIDGKPVSSYSSLYAITRPSAGPGTWWPLIRQVRHSKDLIPEVWTMHVDKVNADSRYGHLVSMDRKQDLTVPEIVMRLSSQNRDELS